MPHRICLITAFQTLLSFVSLENVLRCMSKVQTGRKRKDVGLLGRQVWKMHKRYQQGLCKNSLVETFAWYSTGPLLVCGQEILPLKNSSNCPRWVGVHETPAGCPAGYHMCKCGFCFFLIILFFFFLVIFSFETFSHTPTRSLVQLWKDITLIN